MAIVYPGIATDEVINSTPDKVIKRTLKARMD
jgi:hypothetical protein